MPTVLDALLLAGRGRVRTVTKQLQGFPWYYTEKRWEHLAALRDIPLHGVVLDVGCGFGAFLDLVRQERHALAKGVDLSASAVEVAQALGRPVIIEDVCRLADEEANRYDAVCTFQVLEHVAKSAPVSGSLRPTLETWRPSLHRRAER